MTGFRKAGLLLPGLILGAVATLASSGPVAAGAAPSATARVSPQELFLGDSKGKELVVTVENSGPGRIGSLQLTRPSDKWLIKGCPTTPDGWSRKKIDDSACRYNSAAGRSDDIRPDDSVAFKIKMATRSGGSDRIGVLRVKVARSSEFKSSAASLADPESPSALSLTARSWQITTAVVAETAPQPGSACPPSNKGAPAETTRVIIICGRNRTSEFLDPTAQQSTLEGNFIESEGSFTSGFIPPGTDGAVTLGSWNDAEISGEPGADRTLTARIGADEDQTSALKSLGGFRVFGLQWPVAVDDPADTNEDSEVWIDVLANDNDPDGDPLWVASVNTLGTSGTVSIEDGGVTYDPNGQFENLSTSETASDFFQYTVMDAGGGTDTATVTVTVNGITD